MFLFRRSSPEANSRIQALRELYRKFFDENSCEARGLRLLRGWLSPEQRAQFDAERYFDVIGCDSGKRYRIHYGTTTNVHELDDAGSPKVGWCFMPNGFLAAGRRHARAKDCCGNEGVQRVGGGLQVPRY